MSTGPTPPNPLKNTLDGLITQVETLTGKDLSGWIAGVGTAFGESAEYGDMFSAVLAKVPGLLQAVRTQTTDLGIGYGALKAQTYFLSKEQDGLTLAFGRVAKQQLEAATNFNATTGAGGKYNNTIMDLQFRLKEFGLAGKETSEVVSTMYDSFSDLAIGGISPTEEGLIETVGILSKFGVGTGESIKAMQSLRKGFGQSDAQIVDTTLGLKAFANELGISASKVITDFANQAPMFAVYGDEGVRTFKRLAAASKVTGLEMDTMMGVAKGFDTFKDATTAVGSLNAMLGGPYLNAVELVQETDPTERMKMLKQAFEDAGTSVSDMSYYQQKAFIDMVPGVENAQQLTQMLEGDFDALSGAMNAGAESAGVLSDQAATTRMPDANKKIIEEMVNSSEDLAKWMDQVNRTGFTAAISSAEQLSATVKKQLGEEIDVLTKKLTGMAGAAGISGEHLTARRARAIEEREVTRAAEAAAGTPIILQVLLDGDEIGRHTTKYVAQQVQTI